MKRLILFAVIVGAGCSSDSAPVVTPAPVVAAPTHLRVWVDRPTTLVGDASVAGVEALDADGRVVPVKNLAIELVDSRQAALEPRASTLTTTVGNLGGTVVQATVRPLQAGRIVIRARLGSLVDSTSLIAVEPPSAQRAIVLDSAFIGEAPRCDSDCDDSLYYPYVYIHETSGLARVTIQQVVTTLDTFEWGRCRGRVTVAPGARGLISAPGVNYYDDDLLITGPPSRDLKARTATIQVRVVGVSGDIAVQSIRAEIRPVASFSAMRTAAGSSDPWVCYSQDP